MEHEPIKDELVKNPSIKLADNGFIVSYDCYKKDKSSTYDGYSYVREKTLVFSFEDGDKAWEHFKSLGIKSGKLKETKPATTKAK